MALLVVAAAGCSSGPPAGEGILELNFTDVPDCEVRNGDICATTETRFSLEGPAEQVQFVSGSGGTVRLTLLPGTYELVPEADSCVRPSQVEVAEGGTQRASVVWPAAC